MYPSPFRKELRNTGCVKQSKTNTDINEWDDHFEDFFFFANNDADDNVGYKMLASMILRFFC